MKKILEYVVFRYFNWYRKIGKMIDVIILEMEFGVMYG